MITKLCEHCGKEFTAQRNNARYCCSSCRSFNWQQGKSETDEDTKFKSQLRGIVRDNVVSSEPVKPERKTILVKKDNDEYLRLSKEISELLELHKKLKHEKLTLIEASITLKANDKDQIILNGIGAGLQVGLLTEKMNKGNNGNGFGRFLLSVTGGALAGTIMENLTRESRKKEQKELLDQINVNIEEINVNMKNIRSEISHLFSKLVRTERYIEIEQELPVKAISLLDILEGVKQAKIENNDKVNVNKRLKLPVKTDINVKPGGKIISTAELSKLEYQALNFEGKWREFFGQPSVTFYCIIHGKAGEGKSTFAIQFANYLAENCGVVIYVSGEEGFSKTMKDKFILNRAESENLYIADLRTYQELVSEVKPNTYNFIFIDSLDNMRIGALEMKTLCDLYENSALITISQSTKDGKMRGSNELQHDSDIVVEVVDGIANTTKNRFLPKYKTFNIFESDTGQGLMPRNTVRG